MRGLVNISLFPCLFILSIFLSVYQSVEFQSVRLPAIFFFVCHTIFFSRACLHVCLSFHVSVYSSACLPTCPSFLFVFQSVCHSVYLSIRSSAKLYSVCWPICQLLCLPFTLISARFLNLPLGGCHHFNNIQ